MAKKDLLKQIKMKELKKHVKEEHELLDSGAYAIGSRGYDKACERIALCEEIISRKKKMKLKKVM